MIKVIGANVKKLREQKGFNKTQLAELISYSHSSPIYSSDIGKQGVSIEKLNKIANVLGVLASDLTGGSFS